MAVLHVKTPNGVTKAYDLDKLGGIPVGFEHFSMNPNVPQGWLPLLGGEYNRATYPDLWAWVQVQTGYLKTEADWQALSTSQNGNVPFYSSGDGSTTFRVPSLHCWIKGSDGSAQLVGSYLAAGLPDIRGMISAMGQMGGYVHWNEPVGVFYANNPQTGVAGTPQGTVNATLNFEASRFNSIYGNSDTVQPESIVGLWLVKAYGTIEETGSINEQQYIDEKFAQAKQYTDLRVPTGCVQAFAGNTLPSGWLLCDGSAVSRTSYATLFAAIGTIYGAGDGSTTFNLPNLIDKFVQGNATSGTEHSAGLPNIEGNVGIFDYIVNTPCATGAFSEYTPGAGAAIYPIASSNITASTRTFRASNSNSIYGNSNTVQPPALTMRYIIKY